MWALDRWQSRIRIFRRLARCWATNVIAELNKHKQAIAAEYNVLDLEAENRILDESKKSRIKFLAKELDKLWALEEIKARSRDRIILEGDRNTSYFRVIANHRFRKKQVESIRGPNGMVNDTKGILDVAMDFYKNLFKRESRGNFSL
jgi:hypothetical protein